MDGTRSGKRLSSATVVAITAAIVAILVAVVGALCIPYSAACRPIVCWTAFLVGFGIAWLWVIVWVCEPFSPPETIPVDKP